VNIKKLESYTSRNERLLSLTLNLETKSQYLSMTTSDLTSIVGEHFAFDVQSGLYFVNHLLFVCFHRQRSLVSFSCNRCLVQCVSSRVEFVHDFQRIVSLCMRLSFRKWVSSSLSQPSK